MIFTCDVSIDYVVFICNECFNLVIIAIIFVLSLISIQTLRLLIYRVIINKIITSAEIR